MTTIWFFLRGEGIGEDRWPSVPRVGEAVVFSPESLSGNFRVTEVVWQQLPEGQGDVAARVHLEEIS